jgi:hypothetical protein
MADFYVPSEADTTITIHNEGADTSVDISLIHEMLIASYDEAEKMGSSWADHFIPKFQASCGVHLSRTAAVMLVNQSKEMFDSLKKSSSQSPSSTKGTRSRSPKS